MIQYHHIATHHASSTGGIRCSPIQHLNSQMGLCAAPTLLILVFVTRIICQIILTWLSWNSTSMILRGSFASNLPLLYRLILVGSAGTAQQWITLSCSYALSYYGMTNPLFSFWVISARKSTKKADLAAQRSGITSLRNFMTYHMSGIYRYLCIVYPLNAVNIIQHKTSNLPAIYQEPELNRKVLHRCCPCQWGWS